MNMDQVVLGCVRALRAAGENERADALSLVWTENAKRRDERKQQFEEYAVHQSWRCKHYKTCRCGLDAITDGMGLARIPTEVVSS